MKICTKCNEKKELTEFYIRSGTHKHQSWCKNCQKEYNKTPEYKMDSKKRDSERNKCPDRKLAKKEYYNRTFPPRWATDPEFRKYHFSRNLKKYWPGLSPEECFIKYEELLKKYDHVCAICKQKEKRINKKSNVLKLLNVDHCHTTGRVRGILCDSCNTGLGKFNDNQELLIRAIGYLTENI